MLKRICMVCFLVVSLFGCSKQQEAPNYEKYEQYYRLVDENESFEKSSKYFTTTVEITTLPSDEYRYYIFIDEPKTAMYNCIVLVRENEIDFTNQKNMMPTIGIFDKQYHLVPNQVNTKDGYPKGLVVSGECDDPETVVLDILVEWTNREGTETNREFIRYTKNGEES